MTTLAAADGDVLAHAGGAPEAAFIVLPVVLFGVFFYLEKRARAKERDEDGSTDS